MMHQCIICLDDDSIDNLIIPCNCKGGSQYIHRHCLDTWRTTGINYVNGEFQNKNFYECDVCNFKYDFEINNDGNEEYKRILIYRLYVTRDILFVIGIFQLFICGIGLIIKEIDTSQKLQKVFNIHNYGAYYVSALLLFFAIIGIIGCICAIFQDNNTVFVYNSSGSDNECGACIFVICIIFVIFGIVIGIVFIVCIFIHICNKHLIKLWSGQETKNIYCQR